MLIFISPAKSMQVKNVELNVPTTEPFFKKEADYIASLVSEYSPEELQLLLQISNNLTNVNYERFQQFGNPTTTLTPALFAYTGNVFQHMAPQHFTDEDLQYAQEHLRILSSVYGMLRPLDLIYTYRLALKITLRGMEGKSIYDFWYPKLTSLLLKEAKEKGNLLINLASKETQSVLDLEKIRKEVNIITPEFKEYRNGKYQTIRTYAKMARGEMARYILLNRLEKPEGIKDFKWDNFSFNKELSDDKNYIFTRKE